MATKRKSLSKKTRFEVFKRDGFKCQYCGAASPEAILVVDHIDPISKDGADDMMNYITACQPCNAGKSDRKLDDSTAIQKQRAQLDELAQRREQLEMMIDWRNGLSDIGAQSLAYVVTAWSEAVPGWSLNEKGKAQARKLLKTYSLSDVLDAIETARDSYVKVSADGKAESDSVGMAWSKVPGILRIKALPEDARKLHYVKGILRNRMSYVPYDVMRDLQSALDEGVSVEDMILEAKHARSWNAFSAWLDEAQGVPF